ncbi:cytochrome P450 1B [Aspergillus novofumigatus IBT 16806]|uniref:Cytochrome P450 1B n=1 Tax=Aspergillus novofumigatus (strain IBT 16806) TaxID=1392255 RepID=A0A2I1CH47_ASPN1|nr:cytochrome P450 1B [Aspergillus novofumigatus IBT 16806]PKX96945.1 cytochrome P450 1B [Aspergillus novofumigatus IBT 16806]
MEFATTITFSVMMMHMVEILRYPDEVKKVQSEFDSVVGVRGLPSFEDHESLPFTMAFLSEFIRVVGMLPLAAPHATLKEDFYKGYYIPKDAVILPNQWAANMDPGILQRPEIFQTRALD